MKRNVFISFSKLDIFLFVAVGIVGILFTYATLPKTSDVIVELKLITSKPQDNAGLFLISSQYAIEPWFVEQLKKAKPAKNPFGGINAQVINVVSWGDMVKEAWATVRVSAKSDRTRGLYKYNYQALQIGEPLSVTFPDMKINGIIVDVYVPGSKIVPQTTSVTVNAKLMEWTNVFPESRGIENYVASAFSEKEKMVTEEGVMAEILEKRVRPAEKSITTSDGRVMIAYDPLRSDVDLVIKLTVTKKDGSLFFLRDRPVRVGSRIPIALSGITIFPIITDMQYEE